MGRRKALATIAAVGLLAIDTLAAAAPGDPALIAHRTALLNQPPAQILGNPKGDVTIVEFFDYACPFCKAAEPRVEALLTADKGVRLEVKEFPVLGPDSAAASRAALAAARQNKYAVFHQRLLLQKGRLSEDLIVRVAREVGLDVARLKKDMADPTIAAQIQANLKLASDIHVKGTPTFIVDDRFVTEPSVTIDFSQLARASRASHH